VVHHGPDVSGRPVPEPDGGHGKRNERRSGRRRNHPLTLAIGKITDRYSFEPVLIGASLLPVIATVLVFVLIRPARAMTKP